MVSRRSDLFLRSLFATARDAPAAANDDDSDDEMGAWIWRSSRAAASLTSTGRRAAALPVAASARDPAADDSDRGKGEGADSWRHHRSATTVVAIAGEGAMASRHISDTAAALGIAADRPASGGRGVAALPAPCRTAVARDPAAGDDDRGGRAGAKAAVNLQRTDGQRSPSETAGALGAKSTGIGASGPPKSVRKSKKCRHEGCTNYVKNGGVCVKHGTKRRTCRREGCANQDVAGGVCYRHGAKRKECRHDGCSNIVRQGGVCVKHGAKVNTCRHDGCTKHAKVGGVCYTHGAKVKKCRHEGCTNIVKKGGVCYKHSTKVDSCRLDGCTKRARVGGVCYKHRAKRNTCCHDGCANLVVKGGVCVKHGAKPKRKRCRTMVVSTTLKRVESATSTGQKQKNVATRDVPTLPEN